MLPATPHLKEILYKYFKDGIFYIMEAGLFSQYAGLEKQAN